MPKVCHTCKVEKSEAEFPKNRSFKDGLLNHCKICHNARQKANREAKPEQYKASRKAHYERTIEERRAEKRDYYYRNRERLIKANGERYRKAKEDGSYEAWWKEYYAKNAERYNKNRKDWQLLNPEGMKAQFHRRRGREKKSDGEFTAEEWIALRDLYGKCLRCGSTEDLTPDHVVPLSVGGSNGIENIQPLCMKCNSWKRAKTIDYRPKE